MRVWCAAIVTTAPYPTTLIQTCLYMYCSSSVPMEIRRLELRLRESVQA